MERKQTTKRATTRGSSPKAPDRSAEADTEGVAQPTPSRSATALSVGGTADEEAAASAELPRLKQKLLSMQTKLRVQGWFFGAVGETGGPGMEGPFSFVPKPSFDDLR